MSLLFSATKMLWARVKRKTLPADIDISMRVTYVTVVL